MDEDKGKRLNERLAGLMSELSQAMSKKGEIHRARAYAKAEEVILSITDDITSLEQLKGRPGIGATIMEKMKEYMESGKVAALEREQAKPETVLSDVYGVGPKKAVELVGKGITTIAELRTRQEEVLNDVQKIGLKYYEDILEKIPREEIDRYNAVFGKVLEEAKEKGEDSAKYEIVGSYRRGAAKSGDIDVILTAEKGEIFTRFVDGLIQRKVVIEVLSRGKSKCLAIARLQGVSGAKARRVDFLFSSLEEYPFAILYFTGSKAFNTVMRGHALRVGYTLNEHGLSKMVDNKKEEKVEGNFGEEKDIFEFLGLEYKRPIERLDGRAVVLLDKIGKTAKSSLNTQKMKTPSPLPVVIDMEKPKKTRKVREPKAPKQPKEPKAPKQPKTLKVKKLRQTPVLKEPSPVPVVKEPTPVPVVIEKPKKTRKAREPKAPKPPKEPKAPKQPKTLKVKKPKEVPVVKEPTPVPVVIEKPKKTRKAREPKSPKEPQTKKIREPKEKKEKKEKKAMGKKGEQKGETEKHKEKIIIESIAPPEKPMEKFFKKKTNLGEIRSKITEFRKQGLSLLENLEEDVLVAMIQETNDAYYNSQEALLTDNEFDILKEYVERRFPSNMVLKAIGAPVERNKVKLPYEMPSMDKIKPDTGALGGWMKKYEGPYVLSCKLDGVSGLYVMEKGGAKLYTRGDGVVGQDITHLLRALKLPVIPVGVAIRGEFILPKRLFDEKYRGTFANPRNLVSGIINAKKVDEKASDLHFVAYEVISPEMIPSEQMAKLVEWKLEVVRNESRAALTNEELSEILLDWRANYEYEIDGVIVCDDHIYPRVSGNPEHAFAFKMVLSEQMAECKVVDVIWTPSKNGYLKPRVRIEPVALGGVTIEYATGFNGKFIQDNRIGVGAMIQMIRSGDVIPYIKGVVVPAEVAKMPAVGYEWTDTGVDIILTNRLEDVTVREKNVAGFFVGLEVEGLSIGNIRRLFKGGFDTVGKILRMSVADFESVEGFQKKMAEKIFGGIREKVAGASLLKIMVASNQMGRGLGDKKLTPIMEAFPDILTSGESDSAKIAKLLTVRGIGRENAAEFVANIGGFLAFLRECGLEGKLVSEGAVGVIPISPSAAVDTGHPLYGKKIVMTKIRDKEIIDRLPALGAKLEDAMKKDVFALVVKSHADVSNKVDFAKKNGIPVFTPEEFKARFFV